MMYVTAAWLTSLQSFEDSVGLSQQAKLGRFSKENPLNVCLLTGSDKITTEYKELLEQGSVHLIDCTDLASQLLNSTLYKEGLNYVNEYEALCFLRWIVFSKVFSGEEFIHIDTDLFLNIDPSVVASNVSGLTGTFGSPCFTVISDHEWLNLYEKYLVQFLQNRASFEAEYLDPNRLALRNHIGSDQDFVSILNGRNLLPNSLPDCISDSKFRAFVNPLWPYRSSPRSAMRLQDVDNVSSIDGIPVLFWHLQNDFCRYLARYYFISDMIGNDCIPHEDFASLAIPNPYSKLFPSPAAFPFAAIDKYFRLLALERPRSFSTEASPATLDISEYNPYIRKSIYIRFLTSKLGKSVFSSKYWWQDGIWV